MVKLQDISPADIEAESFRIIEAEFQTRTGRKVSDYPRGEFKVVQRVIHATGDFSIADNIVFQNDAVQSAIRAFRDGGNVLCDVNMVASGVSNQLLHQFGGSVHCRIADEEVSTLAKKCGTTRAEAAMRLSCSQQIGAVAIGNAPTALVAALKLIDEGQLKPGVIVGVPVGFVNAAESKEMLMEYAVPAITVSGRRGGSPIAAAMINALLRLAHEDA